MLMKLTPGVSANAASSASSELEVNFMLKENILVLWQYFFFTFFNTYLDIS